MTRGIEAVDYQRWRTDAAGFSSDLGASFERYGFAVIARHGLQCTARHRAMGDAEALWQFARLVSDSVPAERLAAAVARAMKTPARRSGRADSASPASPQHSYAAYRHR